MVDDTEARSGGRLLVSLSEGGDQSIPFASLHTVDDRNDPLFGAELRTECQHGSGCQRRLTGGKLPNHDVSSSATIRCSPGSSQSGDRERQRGSPATMISAPTASHYTHDRNNPVSPGRQGIWGGKRQPIVEDKRWESWS
jgi:hypothetical protein